MVLQRGESFCLSVSLFVTRLRPAKTAERGPVRGGGSSRPEEHLRLLNGGPDFRRRVADRGDSMRSSPNYFEHFNTPTA